MWIADEKIVFVLTVSRHRAKPRPWETEFTPDSKNGQLSEMSVDYQPQLGWHNHLQEGGRKMSDQSDTLVDDPFHGRRATSHERMTGLPWDASYHHGPAPWDIGRPQ